MLRAARAQTTPRLWAALRQYPLLAPTEDVFPCKDCGIWYRSERNLQAHLLYYCASRQGAASPATATPDEKPKETYPNERVCPFPQCRKSCPSASSLEIHMRSHSGEAHAPTQATRTHRARPGAAPQPRMCPRGPPTTLQGTHPACTHLDVRLWAGPLLRSWEPRGPSALALHCGTGPPLTGPSVPGERPFVCLICLSAFTTKANCERHLKVHTDTLTGRWRQDRGGRGVCGARPHPGP